MKAVILAGGFGTRLKDVLEDVPKPMAPVLGRPFLEYQIKLLKEQGIDEIIIAIHHMADKIKNFFGTGHRWGVEITYSEEETPLGTAGAVKNVQKYIDGPFLVLNGDSYLNFDVKKLIDFHNQNSSPFTIVLKKSGDASHFGNVTLEGGKIKEFTEKNHGGNGLINAGVYLFNQEIFDYIPANMKISIEQEIFPMLAKENRLGGYECGGYFIDIGRPETYEQFKKDMLNRIILGEKNTIREVIHRMRETDVDLILITDFGRKLLGVLNNKLVNNYFLNGGNVEDKVMNAMVRNPTVAKNTESEDNISSLLISGIRHLPIVDEEGRIVDLRFRQEKLKSGEVQVIRGRAPLRISLAGGGTDLPNFFEKYGGVVISSTIDKYCYATIVKRADNKIIIDSDITPEKDINVSSIKELGYDGKFDLVKAIIKLMNPDFGFEIYLHNDVPPGRGLGSSASLSVLVISLLARLQNKTYDEYKIAEIAYRAEREELKIRGGWQDQYAAAVGGFNFMEFSKDKTLVYPLRLKKEVIRELNGHMILCYVGQEHFSSDIHKSSEEELKKDENKILSNLNRIKDIALETKECLLRNDIEKIGELLHESWENKRKLGNKISNPKIDELYEIGLKNGAYGGKLLGAGGGGYILFFHSPKKRNQLVRALKNKGCEIMTFNFESEGVHLWSPKEDIS